jgi:hypothetical protein
MVRRIRSAKRLGTRHDLNYFKRWSRGRKWRVGISIALPVLLIGWFLTGLGRGDSSAFTPGPMSHSHAFIGTKCESCHAVKIKGLEVVRFRKKVTDDACLECHQAPAHKTTQAFTPGCSSCHTEHTGSQNLRQVAAGNCTQCHASGVPHFQAVAAFPKAHPEFRPLQDGAHDPGTVALNHTVHLRPIQGPKGMVQLQCDDCHRPARDASERWRFASSTASPLIPKELPSGLMLPVTYERSCAGCHQLQFDSRITKPAPHKEPAVVRDFVRTAYHEYIAANPKELIGGRNTLRLVPASEAAAAPHTADEFVKMQSHDAEQLLWRKTCKECHRMDSSQAAAPEGLPRVLPSQITTKWLVHASFNHAPHESLSCISCHVKAPTSVETSEVLIPSIQTCAACHKDSLQREGRADNGCYECHQYHDWAQRKPFVGTKAITEVLRTMDAGERVARR